MRYVVMPHLSNSQRERWQRQFVRPGREYLESIWRRSEAVELPDDPAEMRRRLIHIIDRYEVVPNGLTQALAITECYLWLCSTLPYDEIVRFLDRIGESLRIGGWSYWDGIWRLGDLVFTTEIVDRTDHDIEAGRYFPPDYQTVICRLVSEGFPPDRIALESPWAQHGYGVRTPGTRIPDPTVITDLTELLPYLPAHVELGGGASMELGLPPLNYLHTVYGVYTADDQRFAYGDTDGFLAGLLADPSTFFTTRACFPYVRAMQAELNGFYHTLSRMHQEGHVVGSIFTNNFDGLIPLVGLPEHYVRRYEDAQYVPTFEPHPAARSLIVVGSHADRRYLQRAARIAGLTVVFVDPETYVDHRGAVISYPLEHIEPQDRLIPLRASDFAAAMRQVLGW